ncbi:MAG TPA: cysteine desulfurase-like protein [Steroidobacteraceae bacterium]|nr:cysteine desulfurase-like protein [Steroidobacteraceae bacterium]
MADFPIAAVRAEFPALSGKAVFLDNPGGTQVPRRVIAAVSRAMSCAASNLGGYFEASREADAINERAHAAAATLLGASSGREIVIGQSMTMLTFQMARSLCRSWGPGDEIIVTRLDHEGNISPWLLAAEERGIVIRWLPFNQETWRIEAEDLLPLLSGKTRLLALNYASNMTGSINPVATLTRYARQAGALVYVDAVQFTPHDAVDVRALGCDFLACSSYKFFGPHLGVLWGREPLLADLFPYAVRCASRSLPSRHEIGTPQTELIAGLAAAVEYFEWLGTSAGGTGDRRSLIRAAYQAATAYELPLMTRLIDGLHSLPGVSIRGIVDPARFSDRVPTVSFTHPRHRSQSLAEALGKRRFCVWSGHNYAYEPARSLGLDEDDGVLRIGLAHYNTIDEVDGVLRAIEDLVR